MKSFPRGLHGTRNLFSFVIETKTRALGTTHDGTPRLYRAMLTALRELAGVMVKRREDSVPLREASDLINSAFSEFPISGQTWLFVLEGSDILRRDVEITQNEISVWSSPDEVIRFSFQRLQDNIITEHLISICPDIENAFEPGAPLAFLVQRSIQMGGVQLLGFNPQWVGVIGTLWAAIAEKNKKELFDLRSFFGSPDVHYYPEDFRPVFRSSIRERSGDAFTTRTKELLDILWENEQEDKLAIVLSSSCVPKHVWNADFLDARLNSLTLADRDSVWSCWFTNQRSELAAHALDFTNWALNTNEKCADPEVVRLAGITLSWLLTITNRIIRDRATKGLVNLMVGEPALYPKLLNHFSTTDDPYVLDRLLAAGYGSICIDPTSERIKAAARAVAETIFVGIDPPVHLSIRNWACSIMERAFERNIVPEEFNMTRTRPPFGSSPAIFDVTKEELEALSSAAGEDSIAQSCQRHNDFFEYVIKGGVTDFSETPLVEPPPLTQDECADCFEAKLRKLGGEPIIIFNELQLAVRRAIRYESSFIVLINASNEAKKAAIKRKEESDKIISKLEKALIDSIPQTLKASYLSELAPIIHRQASSPSQCQNPEPAGLWIARRAYELGWTKD